MQLPRLSLTTVAEEDNYTGETAGEGKYSSLVLSGTDKPRELYDPVARFFRNDDVDNGDKTIQGINVIVFDNSFLSLNDRLHPYEKSRRVKKLREMGKLVGQLGLAKGTLQPMPEGAHLVALVQYQTKYRVDPANALPTIKAIVDGLVDAKIFPDDDSRHLKGPDLRRLNGLAAVGAREIRLLLEPLEHCTCV